MTDEEINRKVAEIEGWREVMVNLWENKAEEELELGGPPNYAQSWQFCGPLVEKYGIHINPGIQEINEASPPAGSVWDACVVTGGRWVIEERTPQRAICLAVIAAHEGK